MYRTHYPQMWSPVNLCFVPSGWTSGARHRRPQGADGPADQGGAGALGVWWHGLTGQPPAASHSRRNPAPPLLFPVHRWPRHHHEREQPCMKIWRSKEHFHPGENFSIGYLLRYKSVKTLFQDKMSLFLDLDVNTKQVNEVESTSSQIPKCTKRHYRNIPKYLLLEGYVSRINKGFTAQC